MPVSELMKAQAIIEIFSDATHMGLVESLRATTPTDSNNNNQAFTQADLVKQAVNQCANEDQNLDDLSELVRRAKNWTRVALGMEEV